MKIEDLRTFLDTVTVEEPRFIVILANNHYGWAAGFSLFAAMLRGGNMDPLGVTSAKRMDELYIKQSGFETPQDRVVAFQHRCISDLQAMAGQLAEAIASIELIVGEGTLEQRILMGESITIEDVISSRELSTSTAAGARDTLSQIRSLLFHGPLGSTGKVSGW